MEKKSESGGGLPLQRMIFNDSYTTITHPHPRIYTPYKDKDAKNPHNTSILYTHTHTSHSYFTPILHTHTHTHTSHPHLTPRTPHHTPTGRLRSCRPAAPACCASHRHPDPVQDVHINSITPKDYTYRDCHQTIKYTL